MKRFFAPLRLPFAPLLPSLPYYIRAFVLGTLRILIAGWLGPEAYFLTRGRILIALGVFLAKMGFAAFHQDATGHRYALYLALVAEGIQILLSLYKGFQASQQAPEVELVEQIDVVDTKGQVISSYQQKIDPNNL